MERFLSAASIIAVGTFTIGLAYITFKQLFNYMQECHDGRLFRDFKSIIRSTTGVLITGTVILVVTSSVKTALMAAAIPLSIWAISLASGLNHRKKSRSLITRELPLLLDYLVLQVESGHTIQQALRTASGLFLKGGPLNIGLREMDDSIQAGSSTVQALENFGKRLDTSEADIPIMAITQAIQHGTPLGKVLRAQSKRLREHLILEGEKFANTVSIKILIPLLFFIFPASFLVIFSPVIVALTGRLP